MGQASITENNKTGMVIFVCFIAALAGLLFGLDLGYVNGALQFIQKDLHLSTSQAGVVTGILLFGAAFGTVISGFISFRFGRKFTLVIASSLFTVFSIMGMSAHSYEVLLAARFMLGVAVGMASFTAPLYLSEMAPPKMRGGLISLYQLMITIGIMAMFISNYLLESIGSWRLMMAAILIPSIIMFIGCLYLPRSPRWLILKGRIDEARKVLALIRREENIEQEITAISAGFQAKYDGISGLWKTDWLWKVILLGIALQMLQQFSGINALMYYSTHIFKAAGFDHGAVNTVMIGTLNVLTTVAAIFFIDKIGRKPILYTGLILLVLSLLVIGHLFNIQASGALLSVVQQNILFASSLTFIFAFAVSLGPIVWVICSEIFPLQYRDLGITFSTTTNWVANMFVGRYTLTMFEDYGYGDTFYIFAGCCVAGIFLLKFFVPETMGISLEHIEKNIKSNKRLSLIGR